MAKQRQAKFKQPIDEKSAALSLGILFAIAHAAAVAIFVAGGMGLVSFWHQIHFATFTLAMLPFNAMYYIIGIVLAFIAGVVIGWLFARIWNWVVGRK